MKQDADLVAPLTGRDEGWERQGAHTIAADRAAALAMAYYSAAALRLGGTDNGRIPSGAKE